MILFQLQAQANSPNSGFTVNSRLQAGLNFLTLFDPNYQDSKEMAGIMRTYMRIFASAIIYGSYIETVTIGTSTKTNYTKPVNAMMPILEKWESVKDCFDADSKRLLQIAYDEIILKKDTGAARQEALISSGEKYFSGDFRIGFSDAEGFLRFNEVISKDMNENERIGLMAYWLGSINRFYKYSRKDEGMGMMFKSYSGYDALDEYLQGRDSGICGDINGSIGHLLAKKLGLEQSAVVIFTKGSGHYVSLAKGKEGYYLVDYGTAENIGQNLEMGLDRVLTSRGRFTPFGGASQRGIAFEESAGEKFLFKVMEMGETEIRKGMALSLKADKYGSLGLSAGYAFDKVRLGVFALNAPPAMTMVQGAYIDYRLHGMSDKNMETGSLFLPKVYFAAMNAVTAGNNFPLLIAEALPYLYRNRSSGLGTIDVVPLSIAVSSHTKSQALKLSSSVGLMHEFGTEGKTARGYVTGEFRWVEAEENLYDLRKMGVTPKITAGFMTGSTKAELSYKPESIANMLDMSVAQGLETGHLNVLFTLEARLLEKIPGEKPKPINGANLGIAVTFLK